jgi:protease I
MPLIAGLMQLTATGCTSKAPTEESPSGARIAILVAEGFHVGEAYIPMAYLLNQGYRITVIGPLCGTAKAYNSAFSPSILKRQFMRCCLLILMP